MLPSFSELISCSSLCFSHFGLLSVPYICPAHFCFRTPALPFPSLKFFFLSFPLCMPLIFSSFLCECKCHHIRELSLLFLIEATYYLTSSTLLLCLSLQEYHFFIDFVFQLCVYECMCFSPSSKSSIQYDKDYHFYSQLSSVTWVDNCWYMLEIH